MNASWGRFSTGIFFIINAFISFTYIIYESQLYFLTLTTNSLILTYNYFQKYLLRNLDNIRKNSYLCTIIRNQSNKHNYLTINPMRKPKLSINQICYFAMFGNNPVTGTRKFIVNSGKVKGIEFDSDSESIDFILEVPFEISQTPGWLRRFFPSRFAIFKPLHHLYHHFHKDNIYVVSEDEVFYDFRDAVAYNFDALQIQEDLAKGSMGTGSNDPQA